MITDDEVMRVLKQANPASVDDPIAMLDVARYRDVLDARNTYMIAIDSEPTPTRSNRDGRWMILAAAAVVAVGFALVTNRNVDPTPADEPSPTVSVPPTLPPTWSPELTAHPLLPPVPCNLSPGRFCPHPVVSPDGTLVTYDPSAATLTWYEEEPRVVPLTAELAGEGGPILMAIGPYDIAYFMYPRSYFVAVAPSGAELTRIPWPSNKSVYPTATGLVPGDTLAASSPNALLMPWVDLDGNPITDTTPYPTWTTSDAGIEVQLGEREWLLDESTGTRPASMRLYFFDLRPRSDGGVVLVLDTVPGEANLFELLPDGTIARFFVKNTWPLTVLPDGSLIVEDNRELIRLAPPA